MLASLFEKPPELIMTGKGKDDDPKQELVTSVYNYLEDKLDLESFLSEYAWYFLLVGHVSTTQDYKVEIDEYQDMVDSTGKVMLDDNGSPVQMPVYSYNDPIVTIDDPLKTYFSPESVFSLDGDKVPYKIIEKSMCPEEVEDIYGVEVEPDSKLDTSKGKSKEEEGDDDRVCVKYYMGRLSKCVADDLQQIYGLEFNYKKDYLVVFTEDKILAVEEKKKMTSVNRWFYTPNKFFGFGIGKTLRDVQREMSIRRGQQVRYADLHAYPWLMMDATTKVDQKAINDPQKRAPLVYKAVQGARPPEYLVPPPMPTTIVQADEVARSDAQFISGTLDLSKGAQETNTVKTATGQQLFAQSQDKRMNKARIAILKGYRQVVIDLLKLCQENWDEEKVISITDGEGNAQEVIVKKSDLADINFDTDIDFSIDSISENKNTIAEREIALYDKINGDKYFNQRKIRQNLLRNGFNKKNPDAFMVSDNQMMNEPDQNQQPQDNSSSQENLNTSDKLPLVGNEQAPQPAQGFTPVA